LPLTVEHIFNTLVEWPHRGAGSEEEMMAREALVTELLGEPDVDVTEEAVAVPRTYLPFFWMLGLGQAFMVLISAWAPVIAFLGGLLLLASYILFFDWRVSPLTWLVPKEVSANTVAKKGDGERLVILMAHLDSAPASYAYRPDQVKHFGVSVYIGTLVMAFGVIVPWIEASGMVLPVWVRGTVMAILVAQPVIASMDYWKFGYTPGANDNLSGVAAATAAATNLWRHMPENTEVWLVITTAEEAGMLGAQHYWRAHEDELSRRDAHVLNFDTVGNAHLKYVVKSGGFTPVYYPGHLLDAAKALAQGNSNFAEVGAGVHKVGDFDSVWFQRAGISALTIASYDEEGMMPAIHTPEDTAAGVDLDQVALAARFGEGIIRTLPPVVIKRDNENAR